MDTPVLILTAKEELGDKVKAFEIGANDYLTKPFYMEELVARVYAILRTTGKIKSKNTLQFKDLYLDINEKRVFINDCEIELQNKQFNLLEYLVLNKGCILLKEQIYDRLWGIDSDSTLDIVEVYVSKLRKKLSEYGYDKYIKTKRKVGYILDDKLPKFHEEYNDEKIFSLVKEKSEIELIDLRVAFKNEKSQLYYKTDHHLTAQGSYLMYEKYCEAIGESAKTFETKEVFDGFYGTTYSRSGLWGKKPDTIEVWKNENTDVEVIIDDATTQKTANSLFFTEHLNEDDKYPVYLDGNHSLVTIKNKANNSGKKLLIIKDSYAHCFTTFLYEHYSEIYMVDMRYYRKSVSSLVSENGITDVLYLYGVDNFSTDTNSAWLM